MRVSRRALIGVLLVLALATGCHRVTHVTNVPAGASQQQVISWYAATGALKVISETTKTATATFIALHNTAALPDENVYQAGLAALGHLAQTGLVATQFLNSVPQNFGGNTAAQLAKYSADLTAAAQELDKVGLSGIKNPQQKQQLQAYLTTIKSAIQVVAALLPGGGA